MINVDVRPPGGLGGGRLRCHQPAPGYDHLPERCFEFIPLWGFLVFLLYRMRRVDCRNCGVVVEEVPWSDGITVIGEQLAAQIEFVCSDIRPQPTTYSTASHTLSQEV